MAKETKNQQSAAAEINENNIVEIIEHGQMMRDDSFEKAMEEIDDEREKRKIREAKEVILEGEYSERKAVLQLRQRRAEEKATKKELEEIKKLRKELEKKEIGIGDFRKKKGEIAKAKREDFKKAQDEYDELFKKLQNNYPGWYGYEWDRYDRY